MDRYKISKSVSYGCVQFELSYISSIDRVRKITSITIEENDIDRFIELLEEFGFEKVVEDENHNN